MYRGTAILLGVTAAVALAAVLPVAILSSFQDGAFSSRLGLALTRGTDLGLPWISDTQGPADIRATAVSFFFKILLASSIATLVIACVSLLTLSGARALAREGEVAVRRAVGASRRALTAAALLEGVALGGAVLLTGGALGLIATVIARRGWPGVVAPGGTGAALLVAAAVAVMVVVGILLPVIFARRERIGEEEAKPLALFMPTLLQLGLCLIVLAAGAMLIRYGHPASTAATARHDPIFQLDADSGDLATRARGYEEILNELGRHPELGTVSLTSAGTLTGLGTVAHATTDCGECAEGGLPIRWRKPNVVHQFVSADSFLALGIPLLEGRRLSSTDRWGSARVAVVSRSLARDHFQSGEALGRTLQVADDPTDWYTVVGVVDDVAPLGFGGGTLPKYAIYLSILQHPARTVDLLLRRPAPGTPAAATVRLVSEIIGGRAHQAGVVSEATLLAAELAPLTWFGNALRYQGWAMLLIAATGLFSLMRIWVRSAWPEFGLRRAVGARRWQLGTIILLRAGGVGIGGLLLGLWFGPALWGTLPDLITGLAPFDAAALLPTALVLLTVTIAGALAPAWSAMHATPHDLLGSTGE
jgi:putative ABC transport system permease protein